MDPPLQLRQLIHRALTVRVLFESLVSTPVPSSSSTVTLGATIGSVWPVPSRGLTVTYVPFDVGYAMIIKELAILFDPMPIASQVPSPGPWRDK